MFPCLLVGSLSASTQILTSCFPFVAFHDNVIVSVSPTPIDLMVVFPISFSPTWNIIKISLAIIFPIFFILTLILTVSPSLGFLFENIISITSKSGYSSSIGISSLWSLGAKIVKWETFAQIILLAVSTPVFSATTHSDFVSSQ